MSVALVSIGLTVTALFVGSLVSFARSATLWRFLQLSGSCLLVLVVLTHIAEANHFFPQMGWGLPSSPGHYLDLCSAVLGSILLPAGYFLGRRSPSQ